MPIELCKGEVFFFFFFYLLSIDEKSERERGKRVMGALLNSPFI